MTLKGWTVAAALVLLPPCAAHAATEANFAAGTTGDLVELCTATPDTAIGTAAVNFCEGFAQGAVSVEMQNVAAFRGPKLFCLPTRNEALSEFVKMGTRLMPDSGQHFSLNVSEAEIVKRAAIKNANGQSAGAALGELALYDEIRGQLVYSAADLLFRKE